MALGRAAKRELLKLIALAPVRRGEGGVRGLREPRAVPFTGRPTGSFLSGKFVGPSHPSPLPGGPGRGDRIYICASARSSREWPMAPATEH
jgi:hypothetical protein